MIEVHRVVEIFVPLNKDLFELSLFGIVRPLASFERVDTSRTANVALVKAGLSKLKSVCQISLGLLIVSLSL